MRFFLFLFLLQTCFSNPIQILSYNIQGLPTLFLSAKKQKTKKIINESINYQIILYQENWMSQKEVFTEILNNHNIYVSSKSKYPHMLQRAFNPNGAGLTMGITKEYEILYYEEILFKGCSGYFNKLNDCLASKGFQKMTIFLPQIGEIDIYNTHLDAGDSPEDKSIRKTQINQMKTYIYDTGMSNPIVIAGDFNMTLSDGDSTLYYFYQDLDLLGKSIKTPQPMLDYIFIKNSPRIILRILEYQINHSFNGLSDHPAVSAKISAELVK